MQTNRRISTSHANSSTTGLDYEQGIQTEATLADLDLELAEGFLKATPGGAGPVLDSLQHYGLIKRDGESWSVTNAALLLFARVAARRWHPRAGLRVLRVAGTQKMLGRDQNVTQVGHADPPLARAIEEGARTTREQVRQSETLRDIFFRDMPEYPDLCWREALVNAVAHRDYEDQGREIEIAFYDDRLEVSNPGGPPAPTTVDALNKKQPVHATRNPMLVRVLADAGIMRAKGEGIVRIYKEMADSCLHEPRIASRNGLFSITLRNEPVFETAGPGWKNLVRSLPVSPDQKRILLARPDGFTHEDYRRLNAVVATEAKRGVHELVRKGITTCDFRDEDEMPVYYLTPDLDATRWLLEDRVPKLREYFRRDPWLRNADYRALFDASHAHAKRELRQLVELGFLQTEGRGRGKGYLPMAGLRK